MNNDQSQTLNENVNYIPVQSKISWDQYFMLQAMMAAFKSKDPATKVGSVFVDENNHQITMGYNGFVAGIDESKLPWGKDKSVSLEHQKYGYVVHAEANAILHSKGSLKNSKAYVTLFPCHECAKLIASSKVKEVIYLSDKARDSEENRIAKKIFELAGITYRQLKLDHTLAQDVNSHIREQLENL
jgi:dCMP deaminase